MTKPKTFRMLLIDPEARTVTEVQASDGDAMTAVIGSPSGTDTFRLASHPSTWDYAMVDDTGLSRGLPIHAFQFIGGSSDPVAGKCLVYGAEKGGGATCNAEFDLGTLTNVIRFIGEIVPKVEWQKTEFGERAVVSWMPR